MTLKTKMSLLLFLTSISIVSIGFSSWSITAETTAELNGNIQVDNVISSDKYVYLDNTKGENNTGIDCFKYQDYGYLNEDGTAVTSIGHIYAYFILDLEKCDELFIGDYKTLNINLKLSYTDDTNTSLNLFKYNITSEGYQDISSSAYSLNNSINIIHTEIANNNSIMEYAINIQFKDIATYYDNNQNTNKIEFIVQYDLFATTGPYFYNNIYKYLYQDMINVVDFKLRIEINAI